MRKKCDGELNIPLQSFNRYTGGKRQGIKSKRGEFLANNDRNSFKDCKVIRCKIYGWCYSGISTSEKQVIEVARDVAFNDPPTTDPTSLRIEFRFVDLPQVKSIRANNIRSNLLF